jgi:hypothetical protein
MKALKVVASVLLSLILFVCLIAMSAGITVNSTALSPRFVTTQVNKLDVVGLFNEQALPELQKQEELAAHPEIIAGIKTAVEQNAPALKTAVNEAISDVYDYLLHGGTLDLRQTLKTSVLDPELTISILNDLDLSSYIKDLLLQNLPLTTADISGFTVDLTPYTDSMVAVIQPYVKQQAALLIPGLYYYVLGLSPDLKLDIPVTPILGNIGVALKTAFLASPPAELKMLPPAALSAAFDTAWAQTLVLMPATLSLDSSEVGLQPPSQIGQSLDEAQNSLREARRAVIYYREGFLSLIALTAVLVLLIILVNRDVKIICRILGGVLALYGIIETFGILLSRGLIHSDLASFADVPHSLQPWLVNLIDSAVNPLLIFAVVCAVLGIALFVFSFIYRGRSPATRPS